MSAIYNPGHHSGRYVGAANDTGGLLLFHITDSSWANANNLLIAQASPIVADKYDLDQPTVTKVLLKCTSMGTSLQNNWHYDADQQAVIFDSNPPGEGDITEIHYSALAKVRVRFVLGIHMICA